MNIDLDILNYDNVYITSDWHLGETRLDIMDRPFSDTQEMNDEIINNHRHLKEGDLLIINGDIVSNCVENWNKELEKLKQLKCQKWLIRGNHDTRITNEEFKPYFAEIIDEGFGVNLVFKNKNIYITHYPTQGVIESWNLVGHIHSAWKFQKNMINVGVDVHHFKPVPLDRVLFYIEAIKNFYDNDVWCSNCEINSSHELTRGKESTYFKHEN